MKVAIYARVSTKEQNLEMQLNPIKDYCSRNGLEVVAEYLEEGISGAKATRPQLDRMLQDMRDRKFDGIVVYKLDRLGRSLKHLLDLLSEFKNKGIRLVSVVDGIDTTNDSPMNKAFWQMLGVFAELEREIIVARVNDGIACRKKQIKEKGAFIAKSGMERKKLGRPKGSKDKKYRRLSGYRLRYAGKV